MEQIVGMSSKYLGNGDTVKVSPGSHETPTNGHPNKTKVDKTKEFKENVATLKSLLKMFHFAQPQDTPLFLVGILTAIIHGACFPILGVLFGNIAETFLTQSLDEYNSSRANHTTGIANNSTMSRVARSISKIVSNHSLSHPVHTNTHANVHGDAHADVEHGAVPAADNPLTIIAGVFGYIGSVLGISSESGTMTREELVDYAELMSWYFFALAVLVFFAAFLQTLSWELLAEKQGFRMRLEFTKAMLRQEISWFETWTAGYLVAKLSDDLERIKEGIGHKFSIILEYSACFAIGGFFGLCINWELAFICGVSVPFIITKILYLVRKFSEKAIEGQNQYGEVGSFSEEILEEVRMVAAYGTAQAEHKRYDEQLKLSYDKAVLSYHTVGLGTGALYVLVYSAFGGASLFAASQLFHHNLSLRQVYTVFCSVSISIVALSNILPFITEIAYAKGCMESILWIIQRQPKIDPYNPDGRKIFKFTGKIKISDVTFSYPSRGDTSVLNELNLTVLPGSPVALFGLNGTGKSTLVDLLLRFYDPQDGSIAFDGFNLNSLNVNWLRKNVAIVGTVSIFLADTIYNNIRAGMNVSRQDVIRASKLVGAHEHIIRLAQAYKTVIGITDRELSDGQMQLLAIARAIIRKTPILILDEAFSAIPADLAGQLVNNLKIAREGLTTIIISHCVSRICTVDTIHVMKDGKIVESGNHSELMGMRGEYHRVAVIENVPEVIPADWEQTQVLYYVLPINLLRMSALLTYIISLFPVHAGQYVVVNMGTMVMIHPVYSSLDAEFEDEGEHDYTYEEEEEGTEEFGVTRFPTLRDFYAQVMRNPSANIYIAGGLLGSLICGLVPPAFGLEFIQLFEAFAETGDKLTDRATFWSKVVFGTGIAAGLGFWMKTVNVRIIGESVSCFMREDVYLAILRQKIPWFDDESHTSQRLYNVICRNSPVFRVAIGSRLGVVLSAVISLVAAILISVMIEWKLAIILTFTIPIQYIIIRFQERIFRENQKHKDETIREAMSLATDSVQDIRSVQTSSLQTHLLTQFENVLRYALSFSLRQSVVTATAFAISEAVTFLTFAILFRAGSYFITGEMIDPLSLFKVFIVYAFSSFTIAQVTSFVPDFVMAEIAYANLFGFYDHDFDIDGFYNGVKPKIKGRVTFDNVSFRYPKREDLVLHGVSFDLKAGSFLGVIGSEGKSTLLMLILGFYEEFESGSVLIDGINIRSINLDHVRQHVSYVPQASSLLNRTIRENILYGYNGDAKGAELEKLLEESAKLACLTPIIAGLPHGYDTEVGPHGTRLTYAERQQISFARAIIRDPEILLLDEPTSSMDAEQNLLLISSMRELAKGRTCIVVSKSQDVIKIATHVAVMHEGRIVEFGTHEELRALNGRYCHFMDVL